MMKDCREELTDGIIKKLLLPNNEALFEKYIKFKRDKMVLGNRNMKFCPEINCGGYLEYLEHLDKFVQCNNGHKYCFECLNKWHKKRKCEEVIDSDFENWKKGKLIKQCPNCKFWTEKNEGCNHMTCRGCNYEWCWFCSKKYTPDHYSVRGLCWGLQFSIYFKYNIF
jgi:hypothetical protein